MKTTKKNKKIKVKNSRSNSKRAKFKRICDSGWLELADSLSTKGISPRDVLLDSASWQSVRSMMRMLLALEESMFKSEAPNLNMSGLAEMLSKEQLLFS